MITPVRWMLGAVAAGTMAIGFLLLAVPPPETRIALPVAPDLRVGMEPPVLPTAGLWIHPDALADLPTRGPAWESLREAADQPCGSVDLSDQSNSNNVCILAKALVHARIGGEGYRREVVEALDAVAHTGAYDGRALALGRNLTAYVISADLIGLALNEPELDARFRRRLDLLRTTPTWGAATSLVDCHERRPNNWGTHCGASRIAIAIYLGDTDDLARAAAVFRGFLGDRSSYAGFTFGGPYGDREHSWECDPERPVGINPKGCSRDGYSLDGVLPDDQRRGGPFSWPPPKEGYVWEALQGALVQAVLLRRTGYTAFEWEDQAILRAVTWLHEVADFPAEGDDTWQPHLVNHFLGTSFPAPVPTRPGKNVGWTDWTHGRPSPNALQIP